MRSQQTKNFWKYTKNQKLPGNFELSFFYVNASRVFNYLADIAFLVQDVNNRSDREDDKSQFHQVELKLEDHEQSGKNSQERDYRILADVQRGFELSVYLRMRKPQPDQRQVNGRKSGQGAQTGNLCHLLDAAVKQESHRERD